MDETTRKALKGSIRKWVMIVNGTGIDDGADNCPLCRLFFDGGCKGCPVAEATGDARCIGSPYELWSNIPEDESARSDRAIAIAEAEVMFLKSLLRRKK